MASDAAAAAFRRLVDIMARLRGPGGCPWDREQTLASLRPYVLEEAYEVVDAIDRNDLPGLREELGDLLLQIVFQAELAKERGAFDVSEVVTAICEKLERRHPHVFADVEVADAAEVVRNWQEQKARERGGADDVDALVPLALPALPRAQKVGAQLARRGFDWSGPQAVLEKVDEELAELRQAIARGDGPGAAHELGDLLLTVTSLARHLDLSGELVLRDATRRLTARARAVERAAAARGLRTAAMPPEELDRLWRAAKRGGEDLG